MAMLRRGKTGQTKTVQDTIARRDQIAEEGSQRRGNHMKSEMSKRASLNSMLREGSRGKWRRQSTQFVLLVRVVGL